MKELKDQVEKALTKYPTTRNSDITLTIAVWKMFYKEYVNDNSINLKDLYDLPREDNIKRIRAKFQQDALERIKSGKTNGDEQCFLPTDPKVAERRNIFGDEWKKALGYGSVLDTDKMLF